MLGKLLKYDFKALNRIMIPLQLGALVAGVLGSFLLKFSIQGISDMFSYSMGYGSQNSLQSIANMSTSLLAGIFFAVVFASMWVTLIIAGRHLYKSFIKDEGYLTFTLPVSTTKLLLSKTIAGCVWVFINALILVFVVVFMSLVGFSQSYEVISSDVIRGYGQMFEWLNNAQGIAFVAEMIVFALLAMIVFILQLYFSLILGGTVARTHKVLAGIGFYVASSIVMNTITSFASGFGYVSLLSGNITEYNWFMQLQPMIVPMVILYAGFVVAYFLVSKYLLKNKLNLD